MIKEWFYENWKSIALYCACFLLGIFLSLSVTIPVYNNAIRRGDKQAQQLTDRLSEAERRAAENTATITECRESIENIRGALQGSGEELGSIIQILTTIRAEVSYMEGCLYSNYNYSSGTGNNTDSDIDK